MAEANKQSSEGSWFGSWLNAAKQQTGKAFEMVSNDLAEFTSTMQKDTKNAVEKTKETLKNTEELQNANHGDRMKKSFYSLMEGITKALTVEPEDNVPQKLMAQPSTQIFDRATARRRAIQVDTGTYLNDPTGDADLYADWLKSFDIDVHKGEISELLVTSVEVRSLYTSLVPSEVSHQDFWRRYFYKVHQLELDEARKEALMKRAERANVKEDSISWDDEEGWSGDEDSSPEKTSPKPENPESRLKPQQPIEITVTNTGDKSNTNTDIDAKKDTETEKKDTDTCADGKALKENQDNIETNVKEKSDTPKQQSDPNSQVCDKANENVVEGNDKTKTVKEIDVEKTVVKEKDAVQDAIKDGAEETDKSKEIKDKINAEVEKSENNGPKEAKVTESEIKGPKDADVKESEETESAELLMPDKDEMKELSTKLKGDMVVVGDRISPSSESSENKESSTDDWEQDFDVDITEEDLQAAQALASKLNMSSAEYNTITGEDDDWENWE